jgi:hypothetical protein
VEAELTREAPEVPEQAMATRLRIAMEMQQLGLRMKRAVLVREHPGEGPELASERLRRWLAEAPFHEAPGFERSQRAFDPT